MPAARGRAAAVAERTPVPLSCSRCGHTWHSRAAESTAVRCPACGRATWVGAHARDDRPDAPAPARNRAARRKDPTADRTPDRTRERTPRTPARPQPVTGPHGGLLGALGRLVAPSLPTARPPAWPLAPFTPTRTPTAPPAATVPAWSTPNRTAAASSSPARTVLDALHVPLAAPAHWHPDRCRIEATADGRPCDGPAHADLRMGARITVPLCAPHADTVARRLAQYDAVGAIIPRDRAPYTL